METKNSFTYESIMKSVIKQAILYFAICIPLYFLCFGILNLNGTTETRYRTETKTVTEPRVYVTNYGEKYHNNECFYLRSSHARGFYEAQKQGYTACHYCNGVPDGTIDIDYDTEIAYKADKLNEIRAIPIALVIGIFLYFGVRNLVKQKRDREVKTNERK